MTSASELTIEMAVLNRRRSARLLSPLVLWRERANGKIRYRIIDEDGHTYAENMTAKEAIIVIRAIFKTTVWDISPVYDVQEIGLDINSPWLDTDETLLIVFDIEDFEVEIGPGRIEDFPPERLAKSVVASLGSIQIDTAEAANLLRRSHDRLRLIAERSKRQGGRIVLPDSASRSWIDLCVALRKLRL